MVSTTVCKSPEDKAHIQVILPESWWSLTMGPVPNGDVLTKDVPLEPALLNPVDPVKPF